LRDNLLQDDDGRDQPDDTQRTAQVAPAFPPQPSPDAHHSFIPFNPAASRTYMASMTHASVVGAVRAYYVSYGGHMKPLLRVDERFLIDLRAAAIHVVTVPSPDEGTVTT